MLSILQAHFKSSTASAPSQNELKEAEPSFYLAWVASHSSTVGTSGKNLGNRYSRALATADHDVDAPPSPSTGTGANPAAHTSTTPPSLHPLTPQVESLDSNTLPPAPAPPVVSTALPRPAWSIVSTSSCRPRDRRGRQAWYAALPVRRSCTIGW